MAAEKIKLGESAKKVLINILSTSAATQDVVSIILEGVDKKPVDGMRLTISGDVYIEYPEEE